MATHHPKYVSIFKIDGVPILPPLMTTEKRRQMQKYKELAIQLQHSREKQNITGKHPNPVEPLCNLLRHGHSHIPQPQTPRKQHAEASTSIATTVTKRDRLNKLRKTDTIVYDNRANSIILTLEGFEEETEFQSVEIERPHSLDQNDNKISPNVPKYPAKDETTNTPSKPQPYAAFIPIPSICVNPPTPCVPINPICEATLPKRLCGSPTLKPDAESGLIRSHSFTLDGPSSALLEHIKNQKLKKSTATQDTVESKAKRVQKVESKPKAKSPFSTSLGHFPNNTVIFKTKRSPYDIKPSAKTKLARKHKFVKPVTPKKLSPQSNGEMDSTANSKMDMLKDIEEQHRARFLELLHQQQDEQKRLQEQFEAQQKLLIEQLSARMTKVQMQSPPSTSTVDSAVSSPSPSPDQDPPSSTRMTPRRRLFPEKTASSPGTGSIVTRDPSPSPQSTINNSTTARRQQVENERIRRYYWAATKINAYARGFLTRRLLRTDYVQRVVQTIKDTLIFVLNLHMERSQDNSEDSVKLKARLLQQLISASQTLHAIFIQSGVKDRMEIIARDRKYIQGKLMNVNMKRSPRIRS